MGTALVLDPFDTLDSDDIADAALVLVSTPVFKTFLDAGTIPILKDHAALSSPVFHALIERIDRDEFWTSLTRVTDHLAWWILGTKLLERRGIAFSEH